MKTQILACLAAGAILCAGIPAYAQTSDADKNPVIVKAEQAMVKASYPPNTTIIMPKGGCGVRKTNGHIRDAAWKTDAGIKSAAHPVKPQNKCSDRKPKTGPGTMDERLREHPVSSADRQFEMVRDILERQNLTNASRMKLIERLASADRMSQNTDLKQDIKKAIIEKNAAQKAKTKS